MSDELDTGGETEARASKPWTERGVTSLDLDEVFDILSDRRRRYVLHYLADAPTGVVSLNDLADQVVRWETEYTDYSPPDDHRQRVVVDLHHVHLPKLDRNGVVDYDTRSETVRYWGQPVVEEYAQHVADIEIPGR